MEYRISRKRIKGKNLRLAQTGDYENNLRLMASCVVDPATDDYMDKDQAFDLLDDLSIEEQDAETDLFIRAMEAAKKSAVPLVTSGR